MTDFKPPPDGRKAPTRTELVESLLSRVFAQMSAIHPTAQTDLSRRAEALSAVILNPDMSEAHLEIEAALRDNVSVDVVIDEILPIVARDLGERWFADKISFADVSIGTARLQQSIRDLRRRDVKPRVPDRRDARVLLIIPPGEDHTFGLFIAADQLRRAGLIVDISIAERRADLINRLKVSPPRMVGITASGIRTVASVIELVTTVRTHVRGFVPIVLGGSVVEQELEQVRSLPVDHIGTDIRAAALRFGLLASQTVPMEKVDTETR